MTDQLTDQKPHHKHDSGTDPILDLFYLWARAVERRDLEAVLGLYAPNAVLVPTLSNKLRVDRDGLRDYFVTFLAKAPRPTLDEPHITWYGDTPTNSGVYTFRFGASDVPTPARYTFVYQLSSPTPLIVQHHSSVLYHQQVPDNEALVAMDF